ncbi:MAG: CooT family nickel-binding protein [Methylocystaceae bacterium]
MCESNVYLLKEGHEELLMEKVDRLIPGEDDTIFLENVFGERRQVKARIKEMELVRHRIVLTACSEEQNSASDGEWWLEPINNHGHFHAGEEVILRLCQGYNMQPIDQGAIVLPRVYCCKHGKQQEVTVDSSGEGLFVNLGESAEGVISVSAHIQQQGIDYYAKMIVEIGHHDHQGLEPIGLPLEIMPSSYQHAHIGEHYDVTVLSHGEPLSGAKLVATYTGNRQATYPIQTYTDNLGRAKVFLAARGNYLLVCSHENVITTYTLIKSY